MLQHILGKGDLTPRTHQIVPGVVDLEISVALKVIPQEAPGKLCCDGKGAERQGVLFGLSQGELYYQVQQ